MARGRLHPASRPDQCSRGCSGGPDISAVFEHIEPRSGALPGWLDLSVPDDCLVASALLLQSAHPGSAVSVATVDLNLQTKPATVRMPSVEPPAGL